MRVAEKKFPAEKHTSISYQMTLLPLTDPGTRWTRKAGPSSSPLDHEILVERTILILEFLDEL